MRRYVRVDFLRFFFWENYLISSIVAITMYSMYGTRTVWRKWRTGTYVPVLVIHSRYPYIGELSRQTWIRYNSFLKNRKKNRPA